MSDPPRPPRPGTLVTLEVFVGGGGRRVDRGGDGSPIGTSSVGEEEDGGAADGVADKDPSAAAWATAAASPT